MTAESRPIAVIDFETDPFLYGRVPKSFAAGFYANREFHYFWGDNCVESLIIFLESLKTPHLIYAHNGGKFDFHFMLKYLENPIKIIGTRIASCKIGIHELRDSYCALPIPLAAYEKTTIDYRHFETENRESHKNEIIEYLKDDCVFLHALISSFIERFGLKLTIGGASIDQLRKLHPFDNQREGHDKKYRQFYFGGRVQAFKFGVFKAPVKIYDVNSMYPSVMKNAVHPTGKRYMTVRNQIMDKHGRISGIADAPFYFAKVIAKLSGGGLPMRLPDSLDFSCVEGEFFTNSHEIKALLSHGLIKVSKVIEAHAPYETINFSDFVDTFSREKIDAKRRGDKAAEIFAKLILNSSYGKFAQSSEHYKDWRIESGEVPPEPYELAQNLGDFQLWNKPTLRHSFYDVATAASITGASRAILLTALVKAKNPYYCDTDSIICESADELDIDPSRLGAWKFEGEGDKIAIGGKKLYSVFMGKECIKSASKGAILDGEGIERIAMGESIQWKNDAPTFSLLKAPSFIDRRIQATK